ncbi:unnamed protein product, partial [Amoebophrya sp. A25]
GVSGRSKDRATATLELMYNNHDMFNADAKSGRTTLWFKYVDERGFRLFHCFRVWIN